MLTGIYEYLSFQEALIRLRNFEIFRPIRITTDSVRGDEMNIPKKPNVAQITEDIAMLTWFEGKISTVKFAAQKQFGQGTWDEDQVESLEFSKGNIQEYLKKVDVSSTYQSQSQPSCSQVTMDLPGSSSLTERTQVLHERMKIERKEEQVYRTRDNGYGNADEMCTSYSEVLSLSQIPMRTNDISGVKQSQRILSTEAQSGRPVEQNSSNTSDTVIVDLHFEPHQELVLEGAASIKDLLEASFNDSEKVKLAAQAGLDYIKVDKWLQMRKSTLRFLEAAFVLLRDMGESPKLKVFHLSKVAKLTENQVQNWMNLRKLHLKPALPMRLGAYSSQAGRGEFDEISQEKLAHKTTTNENYERERTKEKAYPEIKIEGKATNLSISKRNEVDSWIKQSMNAIQVNDKSTDLKLNLLGKRIACILLEVMISVLYKV